MYEETSNTPESGADDVLEELLTDCFERLEAGEVEALEDICRRNPSQAESLRRRVSSARSLGFIPSVVADDETFPERLGEFRLLERIGGGGMGVVFRAVQDDLAREVALKLIRPEHLYFPRARERFRREALAIARLQHAGIVPIHSVGEERGLPYFAMELIEGASLAALLNELATRRPGELTGADLQQALKSHVPEDAEISISANEPWETLVVRLTRQVAEALEHAHTRGVLHRDVKPSNVMVTPGGRAMLLDFGLAREDGTTKMTRSGQMLGSLPYMAPELLIGREGEVDARADVYALGVTLFELLSLGCPFEAPSSEELRRLILEGRRPSLRRENPRVSWELETVCLTALDPDPDRRYATAGDFARDLGNILHGHPIEARRASWPRRTWAGIRRRPATAVAASLAVILLVGGPAIYMIQQRRALESVIAEQARTRSAKEDADDQRKLAEDRLAVANLHLRALRTVILKATPQSTGGHDVTLRQVLNRLPDVIETEFADLPVSAAELYGDLCTSFRNLGDHAKGREMGERGLTLLREYATDHVLIPKLLHEVGLCRLHVGDGPGGEAALREAMNLHRRLEGETEFLANMLSSLAKALLLQNRNEEARDICRDALAIFERTRGTNRGILLDIERRYGDALSRSGDVEGAETRLRKVVELTEQHFGERSEEVARTVQSLALVLDRLGKLEEAEAASRRALALYQDLVGRKHVFIGPLLYTLGMILMKRGEVDDAEDAMLASIEILEEREGDPRCLARAYAHYAILARDHLDDPQLAIEHFEKALARTSRLTPGPKEAERLLQLGFLRQGTDDVDKAETALRRSARLFERLDLQTSIRYGNARLGLGISLYRKARFREAHQEFRAAVAVFENIPRAKSRRELAAKWLTACGRKTKKTD